jgi:uncharacterized protein YceK
MRKLTIAFAALALVSGCTIRQDEILRRLIPLPTAPGVARGPPSA